MLIAAALVAGAVGSNQTMVQQSLKQDGAEEMKVTGLVTKADEQTGEITIAHKTLVMEPGEGRPEREERDHADRTSAVALRRPAAHRTVLGRLEAWT
jgi:hypothetical protein